MGPHCFPYSLDNSWLRLQIVSCIPSLTRCYIAEIDVSSSPSKITNSFDDLAAGCQRDNKPTTRGWSDLKLDTIMRDKIRASLKKAGAKAKTALSCSCFIGKNRSRESTAAVGQRDAQPQVLLSAFTSTQLPHDFLCVLRHTKRSGQTITA